LFSFLVRFQREINLFYRVFSVLTQSNTPSTRNAVSKSRIERITEMTLRERLSDKQVRKTDPKVAYVITAEKAKNTMAMTPNNCQSSLARRGARKVD